MQVWSPLQLAMPVSRVALHAAMSLASWVRIGLRHVSRFARHVSAQPWLTFRQMSSAIWKSSFAFALQVLKSVCAAALHALASIGGTAGPQRLAHALKFLRQSFSASLAFSRAVSRHWKAATCALSMQVARSGVPEAKAILQFWTAVWSVA